ncbi:metallophosphoesterase family protein [Azohydromonas sediminis]|uniref:metallophosphoesterase family protein n=1 Tax=Azohydromonas sediminis TaxID=2259674 RepID=UPI000E65452B|nr:metallophosphoesterase family protein [Azohydromonas sediminis]
MRIAVVSDIHGNLPALEAVAADIARAGVDLVVNLGDIASGPLWPAETVRWLMARDWPTIRGNHERQVLTLPLERMSAADAFAAARLGAAERAWLAALPATLDLGHGVWCCHATPDDDLEYFLETVTPDKGLHGSPGIRAATLAEVRERLRGRADPVVLCGHSHTPRLVQCDATLVVNPGSVGVPAYDDDHPHPHIVEAASPHARWALVERGVHGWQATLCATAYDWQSAAQQAEAQGRGDWADALRTGRVGRLEAEVVAPGTPR